MQANDRLDVLDTHFVSAAYNSHLFISFFTFPLGFQSKTFGWVVLQLQSITLGIYRDALTIATSEDEGKFAIFLFAAGNPGTSAFPMRLSPFCHFWFRSSFLGCKNVHTWTF